MQSTTGQPLWFICIWIHLSNNGLWNSGEPFSSVNAQPAEHNAPTNGEPSCQKQILRLLVSLPFPNPLPLFHPSWAEGPNILPAVYLARDQINNRTDLLPCHQLELMVVDGGCEITATTAVETTIGLFNRSRVVGVIGPGCSTSSLHTAHLINQPEIELVQIHGGGSPILENREKYPNSIGIVGSTQSFVQLSLALIEKSGWKKIAILFENSRVYYNSTKELFVNSLKGAKVRILLDLPVYSTFFPLDGIRTSLARIVFVFTAPSHSLKIICLAHHLGMVYPAYQWIIISRRLDDFVSEVASLSSSGNFSFSYEHQDYNCSLTTILNVSLNRTFLLSYQLMTVNPSEPRFVNISFNRFIKLYEERVNARMDASPTYWAYTFYDAVWAWARVLHQVTVDNSGIFNNFQYGNKTLANMFLDEFYAHDFEFEGMSGLISFNSSTGFNERPSNLYQILNGQEMLLGYNNKTNIVLLDGRLETILDSFNITEEEVSAFLVVLFSFLHLVLFLITAALHVLTVVYRNSKTVKASSPKLNHFAFIGAYLLLFGLTLFLLLEARDHTAIDGPVCHTVWVWIFPISFTLTVGTVTVRTWRLYRIFNHYLNPGRSISNTALISMLVFLLSVDVIIAVAWTVVDPRKILSIKRTVPNGPAIETVINTRCRSLKYESLWAVLTISYKLSLLTVMVILSMLTRRIPNKTFARTSLWVFSYTFSGVFVIGLGLYYFLLYFSGSADSNLKYFVLYLTLNTVTVLYILCVFTPPLAPVILRKVHGWRKEMSKSLAHTLIVTKRHHRSRQPSSGGQSEERERKTSKDALL